MPPTRVPCGNSQIQIRTASGHGWSDESLHVPIQRTPDTFARHAGQEAPGSGFGRSVRKAGHPRLESRLWAVSVWGWRGDATRWADMVDSDEDLAADPVATPVGLVAPSPVRSAVAFPFHVVLRAYICGLVDARVSRSAMGSLQQLLRGDPRTSPWLCGSYTTTTWCLASSWLQRPSCGARAPTCWPPSAAYCRLPLCSCGGICSRSSAVWISPCLTLWMVLFPGRAPPAARPA